MTDLIPTLASGESFEDLRTSLVDLALKWQKRYGVAPAITSILSELDAALLVGMKEDEYSHDCQARTSVTSGHDFTYRGCRYQVKGSRPSGGPGSEVSLLKRATNFNFDRLIWILYDKNYVVQEAWEWTVDDYQLRVPPTSNIRPAHLRQGHRLFSVVSSVVSREAAGNGDRTLNPTGVLFSQ
jgi:hypothetical protein